MAQIFDRSSNALARASLVLTGLIVIALGVTLDQLQRSPWVTRQGQRPEQPVPFSHKHHVTGLGLQCQYCHTTVEKSSYAGIPPTKTCINCHAQIWTNAAASGAGARELGDRRVDALDQGARPAGLRLLQPRNSREQGPRLRELPWPRRPDAVDVCSRTRCRWSGASTAIAIPRRICAPPARSTTWHGKRPRPSVRCGVRPARKERSANCAKRQLHDQGSDAARARRWRLCKCRLSQNRRKLRPMRPPATIPAHCTIEKFTSQDQLGHFLLKQYHIRTPYELSSCEVCHR